MGYWTKLIKEDMKNKQHSYGVLDNPGKNTDYPRLLYDPTLRINLVKRISITSIIMETLTKTR